jgi:F0F1-type ATP synthase assembly protein I
MPMTKASVKAHSPDSSSGQSKKDIQDPSIARTFIAMGLDMSWRLAVGTLVPIIGGVELDKVFNTSPLFLLVGFALSIAGTILVIRRTMQLSEMNPTFTSKDKSDD